MTTEEIKKIRALIVKDFPFMLNLFNDSQISFDEKIKILNGIKR